MMCSFHPIIRTMFGGQNTVLTLFLLTAICACLRGRHLLWAGVLLGLLSYKPQYATCLVLVLICRGEVRVLVTGLLMTAGSIMKRTGSGSLADPEADALEAAAEGDERR